MQESINNHWVRRTVLFLSGQTVSLFGSSLVQFAISWHITLTTQSGLMMTISTLCGFLPQLLISLFAGVWADRYNRKALIIAADAMIAVFTILLAVLLSMGFTEIWLLFVISAVRSVGAGIQSPAVSAFLPEIVPQEHLLRVNGINSSAMSIMMLVSPAAAGGIYAIVGLGAIFWVDAVTAAIGIALLLLLKTAPREKKESDKHVFADMAEGFRYMVHTKWLWQFMAFYLILVLMFGPVVFLTPLMVARSFGPEPWRLVVHEMVFSAGSIIGGVIIGTLANRFKNRVYTLIFACMAFGATTLIAGFSTNFWFYSAVMLLMGVTMPFVNTNAITVLQTRVREDLVGRIFGLVSIISSAAMPLSMVFFGPLADVMSVELQLIITGAVMTGLSFLMLRAKAVIAIGE